MEECIKAYNSRSILLAILLISLGNYDINKHKICKITVDETS